MKRWKVEWKKAGELQDTLNSYETKGWTPFYINQNNVGISQTQLMIVFCQEVEVPALETPINEPVVTETPKETPKA